MCTFLILLKRLCCCKSNNRVVASPAPTEPNNPPLFTGVSIDTGDALVAALHSNRDKNKLNKRLTSEMFAIQDGQLYSNTNRSPSPPTSGLNHKNSPTHQDFYIASGVNNR